MKTALKAAIVGGLAFLATPAEATPTFLTCHMAQPNGEVFQTDVQMNEEAGTVTYSFPDNGRTFTVRGFFTSNNVSFGSFKISRTDLTFTRDNVGSLGSQPDHPVSVGKCVINREKRAF